MSEESFAVVLGRPHGLHKSEQIRWNRGAGVGAGDGGGGGGQAGSLLVCFEETRTSFVRLKRCFGCVLKWGGGQISQELTQVQTSSGRNEMGVSTALSTCSSLLSRRIETPTTSRGQPRVRRPRHPNKRRSRTRIGTKDADACERASTTPSALSSLSCQFCVVIFVLRKRD